MKKFPFSVLTMLLVPLLLLSGCTQDAAKVSTAPDPNNKQETSVQKSKKFKKIVFDGEIPDPQAAKMSGYAGGTASFVGSAKLDLELLEASPNVYEGTGEMRRVLGQKSTLDDSRELSSEIQTIYRLGKMKVETGSGTAQGILHTNGRIIDDKKVPTMGIGMLTQHLHKTAGLYAEYPYTLILDGEKAKLSVTI